MARRRGLRILIACGATEKKLRQKIAPIQASPAVEEILLVRKSPFTGEKIRCYAVPRPLRLCPVTAEAWRLLVTLGLCLVRRPDAAIAMTLIAHGLHTYAAHLAGVPLIHHIMGKQDFQLHAPRRDRLRRIMWWFALRADVLVVRGEPTRRLIVEKGGKRPDRVFVQHNVFDLARYTPDPSVEKEHDLVYVGYLAPYKRVDLLIEVLGILEGRGRAVRLAVAGEGRLRRALAARCEALGVGDRVRWLGTLGEEDLIALLRASRVFAMTSLGEGLPQAMIEAMACGLPCVLFDDADMREIIRPGENGVLVPPGDTAAFADEIERLLSDDAYCRRIAAGALRIHEEYGSVFTVEAQEGVWSAAMRAAREARRGVRGKARRIVEPAAEG
jgi:glycosyltransferase involved in cell wall biosynthesis